MKKDQSFFLDMGRVKQNITIQKISSVFQWAIESYNVNRIKQADLLPIVVLALDHLLPDVVGNRPQKDFSLCVSPMKKGSRPKKVKTQNSNIWSEECLVDINIMYGKTHPYETVLTAESEGYENHAVALQKKGWQDDNNDMMWDLYKLLMIPSPIRFFVTRCSRNNQECLYKSTKAMVGAYAHKYPESIICTVQMPTAQLKNAPATVAIWAKESGWNVDDEVIFSGAS
ncbi:hypothetical protein SAMN02745216_02990 [Desulfatibacillum alkenivorans DSM 16219]|uniref:Uncharacterized protein n=1 Tax=Desulfatibacillum alkenivorans DSM 16219 TaxID=1121393 RepID=A0A1M6Q7W6_9BACT|nr:hypothetical protein [Desulfatibacillum alkenivorans]SHK16352.1 hypothetical protein SAMN02745216_02990 [Desulfatibacillum alkenivorans DSM 16219]